MPKSGDLDFRGLALSRARGLRGARKPYACLAAPALQRLADDGEKIMTLTNLVLLFAAFTVVLAALTATCVSMVWLVRRFSR